MFKTCYIFVIACLCFEFIILGTLLLLFMLCIRTILVLRIVFFRLVSYRTFACVFLDLRNEYVCVYVCSYVRMYALTRLFTLLNLVTRIRTGKTPNYGHVWWQSARHPCGKITIARRPACDRHPLTANRAWWPSGDRCVRPVSGEN